MWIQGGTNCPADIDLGLTTVAVTTVSGDELLYHGTGHFRTVTEARRELTPGTTI